MTAHSGGKPSRFLYLLYAASSLAGGLGLLIPLVALALVLAYGFGHVHGAVRLFFGFMALVALAGALPEAMRLSQTLRIGTLKVSGAVVQRLEAPRRFWTWVAFAAFFVILKVGMAIFFAWFALQLSA